MGFIGNGKASHCGKGLRMRNPCAIVYQQAGLRNPVFLLSKKGGHHYEFHLPF